MIGLATVTSEVRTLDTSVLFQERRFTEGAGCASTDSRPSVRASSCAISSTTSRSSPTPAHWSFRMRRASLLLPDTDAALIKRELQPLLKPYGSMVGDYSLKRR